MNLELPKNLLFHGVFGSQKTSRSATASKHYPPLPADVPKGGFKPLVNLSDMCFNAWDSQPLLGFPGLGLDVPQDQIINCAFDIDPNDSSRVLLDKIVEKLNANRKATVQAFKNGARVLVHDTLSAKDTKLVAGWTQIVEAKPSNDSSQRLYRAVLKTHVEDFEFYNALASKFPEAMNIWLCHADIRGKDAPSSDPKATAATNLQRQVRGLTGPELGARITGQSWDWFHQQCPIVFFQDLERNERGEYSAVWITKSNSISVKCRLPFVPEKIPADFRVLRKYLGV